MSKLIRRKKIQAKIRKNLSGTAERPRLSVFRSNKEIYAQVIDDINGHTIASASSRDKSLLKKKGTKTELAKEVGVLIGKTATKGGVTNIVFDRSGYLYHGRVKALAEGARENGLTF
jgi:large subunit ribosomal protein L18